MKPAPSVRGRAEKYRRNIEKDLKNGPVVVSDKRRYVKGHSGKIAWLAAHAMVKDGTAVIVSVKREKITMGPLPHVLTRLDMTIKKPEEDAI
jgi:hypothetical protein